MNENWKQWILLLGRPAFAVQAGKITVLNEEAMDLGLMPGTPVEPLLASGQTEYEAFEEGCLYLPLDLDGTTAWASVQTMEDARLFLLERLEEERELKALALAAQNLRIPLSNVMTVADRLLPQLSQRGDPKTEAQMAELNRGLCQLLRAVGNMSDAGMPRSARLEGTELGSFLYDLAQRGGELLEASGVILEYKLPAKAVYAQVDRQLLERAVYNLLSNSAKYCKKGGKIGMRLEASGDLIRIVIQDDGDGVGDGLRGSLFGRFRREPGLGDSRWGIGLGLQMVHQAAKVHKGTLLMRQIPEGGTEMVLSLQAKSTPGGTLRSPVLSLDYAGARDHALIELADVLPAKAFAVEKVN